MRNSMKTLLVFLIQVSDIYVSYLFEYCSTTDIEKRFLNSYTSQCNGVVSHVAPVGGIRVFADHTPRNKRKQNASTIFARCAAFHTCLPSCSDHSTYPSDESLLFWSQEKPKYPQFEPHAGIKMVQVLGSPVFIFVLQSYTWDLRTGAPSRPQSSHQPYSGLRVNDLCMQTADWDDPLLWKPVTF